MSDLFLLSEAQMRRIAPYFPLSHGIARVDDRMVISGMARMPSSSWSVQPGMPPASSSCRQTSRQSQPTRAQQLNPVENIWQYIRANWLSNRVFENYDATIEAICEAWNNLIEIPDTIKSIGMREWAHVGRSE